MTLLLLVCVASYLVGSLPFGLWIGLLVKGVDIRALGSKNIGATNVLRVLGVGPGLTAFALDMLKGVSGVALARALWPASAGWHESLPELTMPYLVVIGVCAILGHTFSVFLGFRGGKGVATSFGALVALSWEVAVIALIAWCVMLILTRYVSVASLVAAYTIPFAAVRALQGIDREWMLGLGVALSVLVTVKHRANIKRLLTGTEPKIGERIDSPAKTAEVK